MYDDVSTFLAIWIIGTVIVALVARSRGVATGMPVMLSLLLSPLIGLLVALFAKPSNRGECWQCREQVIRGALKCRHCGADLAWTGDAAVPPAQKA